MVNAIAATKKPAKKNGKETSSKIAAVKSNKIPMAAARVKVKTPAGKKATAAKKQKKTVRRAMKQKETVRYRCRLCGYIYSPLRGEPHNGIPAGTVFDDLLPDNYVCPVCALDPKIRIRFGKVFKHVFGPLDVG